MAIERRCPGWRQLLAALAVWFACGASARADDPASAPEARSGEPRAVRQAGGERGPKLEVKRRAADDASQPSLVERLQKLRAARRLSGGEPQTGADRRYVLSRAPEPAVDGEQSDESGLSPEQREQRRIARGKQARRMHWRAIMQHVRRPGEIPPGLRSELREHARRLAKLTRIEQLAKQTQDVKTVERVAVLRAREQARHGRKLREQLDALESAKTSTPPPSEADRKAAAPAVEPKEVAEEPDPEAVEEEEDQGGEP
jgi:hypothetical protein